MCFLIVIVFKEIVIMVSLVKQVAYYKLLSRLVSRLMYIKSKWICKQYKQCTKRRILITFGTLITVKFKRQVINVFDSKYVNFRQGAALVFRLMNRTDSSILS